MKRFIAIVIRNTVLVNVLMILIFLLGWASSIFMVKELFPEISVDAISVSVPYPGADPAEVEEGISRKIEEAIDGMEGLKRYRTVSSENMSTSIIEIKEGYGVDEIYTDIRSVMDTISTFPVDAEKPIIREVTLNSEVILMAIWGDQDEKVLKEFGEIIKNELQALPGISQVGISGSRDYEIAIEISEEKLREYGLSLNQISEAVRKGSINLTGGNLRTTGEEIRLRTVGRNYTAKEFSEVVVLAKPNGDIVTLGQIADINDGFVEDRLIPRFNGHSCVMITIEKTPSEDAIAIVETLDEYLESRLKRLPEGIQMTPWADFTKIIEARIDLLVKNGCVGLIIVFLSLWFFLDLRLSFWVTLGIPISLSGGLFIMWITGSTLNTISVFGLIMVLGIVVDDAIIVGESIYVHRRNGDNPMLAAVNGVMEVGMPVLAAVTTTIVAFIPLGLIGGVLGKFIEIMPVAVIASLAVSLIECLFILPSHLKHLPNLASHNTLPKPEEQIRKIAEPEGSGRMLISKAFFRKLRSMFKSAKRRTGKKGTALRKRINGFIDFLIYKLYKPSVGFTLHYRYIFLASAIALMMITIGMFSGGRIKFVIFPEIDGNDAIAEIEFPNGTPIEKTNETISHVRNVVEELLEQYAQIEGKPIHKNIYMLTGQIGTDIFSKEFGNNKAMIRVELVEGLERNILAQDLVLEWEEAVGNIPGVIKQSFHGLEQGPPGAAINIAVRGEDQNELLTITKKIRESLYNYEGVYQIQDSYRPGKNELKIDIKPEARTLGLTLEDLARQINAGFYGQEALRIQRGRDDIRVKIRYTEQERTALAKLEQVRIRTPRGNEVPFFSVADITFGSGYANIVRVNGLKEIQVTAEVDLAVSNPNEVLSSVEENTLIELQKVYPNFSYSFDGPQRDAEEAFLGLLKTVPVALIFIFMIIASIFRSYIQPVLIMLTIPFGIIGAIYGHYAMGYDIYMFSVFGMVALTGVVVNDAIVLIEAVNGFIAKGNKIFDAIVLGGVRRFRAIMLTTISTVGGLLPLIAEKDQQAQIIIPMALSIAAGVIFATVLTLFYIPCLMGILNDFRRVMYWLFKGFWPEREMVEPARNRLEDPFIDPDEDKIIIAK